MRYDASLLALQDPILTNLLSGNLYLGTTISQPLARTSSLELSLCF